MNRIMKKAMKNVCTLYKKGYMFEIAWAFFVFASTMMLTAWLGLNKEGVFAVVLKGMRYFAYAISSVQIILNVLYKKYSVESIVFYFIYGVIAIISMFVASLNGIFLYFLIFFTAYKVNSKRLVFIATVIQSVVLITVVISSALGLSVDYVFDATTRMRHSLGFFWTMFAPHLFFFISLQCIYLLEKKGRNLYIACIILEIINIVFYLLTDTRTSFLIITLFLLYCVMSELVKIRWNRLNYVRKIPLFIPAAISVVSILIPLYNQNSILWRFLDNALNGRMRLGKGGIINYGLTFFGQKIEWIGLAITNPQMGETYNFVDCSYLKILLDHGLLFLTVCILIYTMIIYKAEKSKNKYLLISILAILVFSVTDPRLMDMSFNIFPVLAFCGEDVFKESRTLHFMARKLPSDKAERYIDRLRVKIGLENLEG